MRFDRPAEIRFGRSATEVPNRPANSIDSSVVNQATFYSDLA